MKVIKLNNELVPSFRKYYSKYSKEQDESYPPPEDYSVNDNEPANLLIDDAGNLAGAAALMLTPEYRESGAARFRMFHCNRQSPGNYQQLLNEILKHTEGLNYIYCFTEEKQAEMWKAWEEIGFFAKRFAWILEREPDANIKPAYPSGFELKAFRSGIDDDAYCSVINDAFLNAYGHVRMTPERIKMLQKEPSYFEGGIMLLWQNNEVVGSISLTREKQDGKKILFIDGLCVIHSMHGRGLGKAMLHTGIEYAAHNGYDKVMLSVNAENEKAAELYLNAGFKKEAFYKSYYYDLKKER